MVEPKITYKITELKITRSDFFWAVSLILAVVLAVGFGLSNPSNLSWAIASMIFFIGALFFTFSNRADYKKERIN